jgi:hypothetical protein
MREYNFKYVGILNAPDYTGLAGIKSTSFVPRPTLDGIKRFAFLDDPTDYKWIAEIKARKAKYEMQELVLAFSRLSLKDK